MLTVVFQKMDLHGEIFQLELLVSKSNLNKKNAACKHLISYISFGFRCVEYSFSQTDECCVVAFLSCWHVIGCM